MLRTVSCTLIALAASLPAADSAYVVPVMPGVVVKPIATVPDALPDGGGGSATMVGIPDGMGAFDNGDGTFTLVLNNELGADKGVARAHGSIGAFVSRWTISASTLAVSRLADQITSVYQYSGGAWSASTTAFDRMCSADLAAPTAFYDSASGKGLPPATGRFFLNGEESSASGKGRALAHAVSGAYSGQSIVLPHAGRAAWENLVACPAEQSATVVMALDDTSPGQLYVYVGAKQTLGSANGDVRDWAAAAGLVDGTLFTVVANGQLAEQRTADAGFVGVGAGKGVALRFGLAQVAAPATVAGYSTVAAMNAQTEAVGGTYFLRPEDGVWDPVNHDTFYFLTTDRFDTLKNGGSGAASPVIGRTRLWKLVFDDIADPAAGGTVTMVLDGADDPGPQMLDNITMDRYGRILMQEDPGNADHAAAIWMYDTLTGALRKVAKHDPSRFGDRGYGSAGVDGAKVLSQAPFDNGTAGASDEESSGIIDASALLGPGWFLLATQAHSTTGMDATAVERGQIMSLYVPFTQASGGTYQAGNLATITYTNSAATPAVVTNVPVRDGGLGSSMAPVPGQPGQFWCLTDRGPNAAHPSDAAGKVFAKPGFSPNLRRVRLNGDGTITVLQRIDLTRADGTTPITGLPIPPGGTGATNENAYAIDAVGAITTIAGDAEGLDSEGLVAAPDGTFWISDEYGPFIAHVAADGRQLQRINTSAPVTIAGVAIKLPAVLAKREINRGMEGLCMTPDGSRLVGIMQSPLATGAVVAGSSAGQSRRALAARLVEITLATGAVREFAYLTDTRSTAVNEIVALSNTTFLVLERDGNFASQSGAVKKVYSIDIATATDFHDAADGADGRTYTAPASLPAGATTWTGAKTVEEAILAAGSGSPSTVQATAQLAAMGITPAVKTLAVDLAAYKAFYNHDKVEGLALVGHTLHVINDDDFGITDGNAAQPVAAKQIDGTVVTQTVSGTSVAAGLQDYTQILSIDLSATGSSITAANSTPAIAVTPTLVVAAGATATATVTIGDVETPAAALTLGAVTTAAGTATATVSGSGSSRTLTVTGVASGEAAITLTVTDAGGASRSAQVQVSVPGGGGSTPTSSGGDGGSSCGAGSAVAAGLVAVGLTGLSRRRRR